MSSGSSGRVVPVARGSVVPTVLWFLSSSCSPRIPFQSWIRVAFHMGQDTWAHVLSCQGKRESRSIAGRHLSLQFEFQGSALGKGEADRIYCTVHVRDCSFACVGLSKRLGMALPVVSNSCRVSSPAGCAGARTISEFSILSQHGSRPVQLRACAVLDLPLPSRDRILQMSS
jgi:hypothetical protein